MAKQNKTWKKPEVHSMINDLASDIFAYTEEKGFWEGPRNDGEMIALMHSELSEALEGLRHGNPPDNHCPQFRSTEVELADCFIRILDYCFERGLDIAGAIEAKMDYNLTRPHRHGKVF